MEKITINNANGTMEQINLISAFKTKELNKDFIILSKGESAGEGLTKIYISEIKEEQSGVYKMLGVQNDDIWNKVKLTLKEIVNNNMKDMKYLDKSAIITGMELAKVVALDKETINSNLAKKYEEFIKQQSIYNVTPENPAFKYKLEEPKVDETSKVEEERSSFGNLEDITAKAAPFDNVGSNSFDRAIPKTFSNDNTPTAPETFTKADPFDPEGSDPFDQANPKTSESVPNVQTNTYVGEPLNADPAQEQPSTSVVQEGSQVLRNMDGSPYYAEQTEKPKEEPKEIKTDFGSYDPSKPAVTAPTDKPTLNGEFSGDFAPELPTKVEEIKTVAVDTIKTPVNINDFSASLNQPESLMKMEPNIKSTDTIENEPISFPSSFSFGIDNNQETSKKDSYEQVLEKEPIQIISDEDKEMSKVDKPYTSVEVKETINNSTEKSNEFVDYILGFQKGLEQIIEKGITQGQTIENLKNENEKLALEKEELEIRLREEKTKRELAEKKVEKIELEVKTKIDEMKKTNNVTQFPTYNQFDTVDGGNANGIQRVKAA